MSQQADPSGGAEPGTVYLRATDPLPLESPEFNKLHEFYAYLAVERLTTTRCKGCGRIDWPPRGFCPACTSDAYDWVDLPHDFRHEELAQMLRVRRETVTRAMANLKELGLVATAGRGGVRVHRTEMPRFVRGKQRFR